MTKEPQEIGESNVIEFLRIGGMDETHPDFHWFKTVMMTIVTRMNVRKQFIRKCGRRIIELSSQESLSNGAIREITRIGVILSEEGNGASEIFQISHGFIVAAKARVVESERQSANSEREKTVRNAKIKKRFEALTSSRKPMSQRAAARKIKSELKLGIDESRIRQIATK